MSWRRRAERHRRGLYGAEWVSGTRTGFEYYSCRDNGDELSDFIIQDILK
jgi:hypothetical protein